MKRLAPIGLALLAACTQATDPWPAAAPDPETAACRREAERDPDVQEAILQLDFGSSYFSVAEAQLAQAREKAVRACLVRRGIQPRGGVEAPLPYR